MPPLSNNSLSWGWCDADPKHDLGAIVPALSEDDRAIRLFVGNGTEPVRCCHPDLVHDGVARGYSEGRLDVLVYVIGVAVQDPGRADWVQASNIVVGDPGNPWIKAGTRARRPST